MICPKCQFDNPELNRFCGGCGSPLRDSETKAQPAQEEPVDTNAVNGGRPFIVSTTAPADVTFSNSRVVAPSPTIGSTTHASYLPLSPLKARPDYQELQHIPQPKPTAVDPLDEPLFADNVRAAEVPSDKAEDLHEVRDHEERRARRPVTINSASTSGSILGLGGPPLAAEPSEETTSETYEVDSRKTTREEFHSAPGSFLTFDDTPGTHPPDVSGPSFLGLGAADNPDYLLEDQRPSHARVYLLLFALAVVGVLGFLEWRASSRGESMNPVEVLHIKLPQKKGQEQPVAEPPSSSGGAASSTAPAGGNNSGKPDLIAEPTQPASQSAAVPPANSATAPEASQSSTAAAKPADSTPANNTTANTNAAPPPATSTAKAAEDATAKEEKPAPPTEKKPAEKKPVAVASAKTPPSKARAESGDAENAPDASLNAGSFELQKGIAAGATNEGRMWLWRAMGKGNGEAPVLLADIYAQGRGTPKDCEQAVLLLKAAAKKANPRARTKLGSMYASGQCVPRDRVEAYKWMHAALQVNPGSEWIQKNQETLWSQMTASERRRSAAYR